MDAQLLALAKAQDEFRQTVAVGLTDLKSIYDSCAREHANEQKQRANEQESARRAIDGANGEREKLEQKLMQCEHALSETKHALVETREKAKDVRMRDGRCDAMWCVRAMWGGRWASRDARWIRAGCARTGTRRTPRRRHAARGVRIATTCACVRIVCVDLSRSGAGVHGGDDATSSALEDPSARRFQNAKQTRR